MDFRTTVRLNVDMGTTPMVENASVFMGVSLSNRVFNRTFTKSLGEWVLKNKVQKLSVVVFDACEVVNIQVFHGLPPKEAHDRARMRALEMMQMFTRVLSPNSISVGLQSTYKKDFSNVADIEQKLRRAYAAKNQFYTDICEQIRVNLALKAERVGDAVIESNLDGLSEYIILELAWCYAFFTKIGSGLVEVYPGAELFTKRKLVRGEYVDETGLQALQSAPYFIDLHEMFPIA